MKVYHIRRLGNICWDEYEGHIVSAEDEQQARSICASLCADEGPDVWLDPGCSVCVELNPTEPGLIMSSFNAG